MFKVVLEPIKTTLSNNQRLNSMSITKRLQECTSYNQAIPLLKSIKAGPALHKIVETAMLLKNHADPHQREYGSNFMRTALQELEMDKDEQPTPHHGDSVTVKGDKIIKEEELVGGNPDGTEGSEQSSDNEGPYPQVGTEEPNSDIESMQGGASSGDNQMKEGQSPMGMYPRIEPGVAQEMGNHMPQVPPMNTSQQMRQMQYTVNEAVKRYVTPLRNQIQRQQEAIKVLVKQVQESEARTGSMKLDLGKVKGGSQARVIQETISQDPIFNPKPSPIHSKVFALEKARSEIAQMDKAIRQNGNYIQ